jgi:NAD(P)-dependent dehydrogenase (short-subunit alcohol dehydrogenase family)
VTTVLITGATDGLGRAVAERLARDGADVVLHGRSAERLAATAGELERATGARPRTVRADLASLAEVRAMAAEVRETLPALDVLVNNAGIGAGLPDLTTRQESRDGFELRFAVNHLAGFELTLELLPVLRASAPARVVHVASAGQAPIDFDDPMVEHGYSGSRAYCQSKLAQIACGFELAGRIPAGEVTVTSLHPGTYMPTKIVLEEIGRSVDTLESGTDAVVRLAVAPELAGVTGRYFDRTSPAEPHPQATDPEARRRLWELSVRLTDAPEPPA